jgi:predicted site-specific integrase-resolvase
LLPPAYARWAEQQGVSYATARRWFDAGELPVPARRAGRLILVAEPQPVRSPGTTAVYARVSPVGQTPDLDRQVARVTARAAGEGLAVGRVVTEAGSALSGRREFLGLLRDRPVTTIVAGHRSRFALSGGEYVQAALAAQGRRLPAAGPSGADEDLVGT